MTAPERIYLQGAADAPDCEDPNSGVTWCWHQIDDTDVEYVRTDIAARATAEQSRDSVIDACAALCDDILEKGEYSGCDIDCYQETADRCAKKIRALKSQQDAAIESQRSGYKF